MTSILLTDRMRSTCWADAGSGCDWVNGIAKPVPDDESRRLVTGLRAFRPRLVFLDVIGGGCFEQRAHLVLHGRNPIRYLQPFGAVPLLHVGAVMAVMVAARHAADRRA